MTATQLFQSTKADPPLLLRRTETDAGIVDEAFIDGEWKPTKVIVDYLFGHNDFVDEITERQARELEPGALS